MRHCIPNRTESTYITLSAFQGISVTKNEYHSQCRFNTYQRVILISIHKYFFQFYLFRVPLFPGSSSSRFYFFQVLLLPVLLLPVLLSLLKCHSYYFSSFPIAFLIELQAQILLNLLRQLILSDTIVKALYQSAVSKAIC